MNAEDGTLIELDGVYRYYGDQCAVEDLSLRIARGEVVGLLGPNGAGKSSILSMIAGTLAPHAGRILIDGIDLLAQPEAAKARIGFLPEIPPLQREQTVDEFLGFCARLHRVPKPSIAERCASTKRRCGLDEVGRRLIGSLSKGYQQRVGIAQALLHTPPVVILDEPTVGLDPIQIREIRDLIRELGDQHSVILSTHILPEVQTVCERVILLHEGRKLLDRRLQDLESMPGPTSTQIRLRNPPPVQRLQSFAEVRTVEERGAGRFIVAHNGGDQLIETLVRTACENGWGLLELRSADQTLETLFVQLTSGELSVDEPSDA